MSKKKKPYDKRTDIEKIEANWTKTVGLISRGEWSSAIIRAAITVELAANLVIRKEFQEERNLDSEFVDSLIKWANGVQGKLDRLILPISKGTDKHDSFKRMRGKIHRINEERNLVVHGGRFGSEYLAKAIVTDVHDVIVTLVEVYEPDFRL